MCCTFLFFITMFTSFSGLLKFFMNKTYFLISLLSLELLGISMFMKLVMDSININMNLFLLIFIIFLVSESCLGLSILIFVTSLNSNDYMYSMNNLMC